jgi:hypothetical protein
MAKKMTKKADPSTTLGMTTNGGHFQPKMLENTRGY